ncbi:MAG: DUF433 domain-containing protein [Oscillatoria princeps RMCB-10]|nr:DUF433 domain-containing protein [Oscillatoria princeps RMCB-10]
MSEEQLAVPVASFSPNSFNFSYPAGESHRRKRAAGETPEQIISAHPRLTPETIPAALT